MVDFGLQNAPTHLYVAEWAVESYYLLEKVVKNA